MRNSITKLLLIVALFGGGIAHAEIQVGSLGRNGTQHTGFISCPNNEKITHFELAFDSSSSARDDVPYDMYINGVKIYNNRTPWSVITSGYNTYATTTPVSHSPVDCYGQATWLASSTSPTGESMRILYNAINVASGANQLSPLTTFQSNDRVATLFLASNPTDQYLIAGKVRFANSVYYLATSTTSGGGGSVPSTIEVTSENDELINFALLFAILLAITFSVIVLLKPFYARK